MHPLLCPRRSAASAGRMRSYLPQIAVVPVQYDRTIFASACSFLLKVQYGLFYVHHTAPWPTSAGIRPVQLTAKTAAWFLVCWLSIKISSTVKKRSKVLPDYGWTSPNATSTLSHDCSTGVLWASVAPILRKASLYTSNESEWKPLSHVICLWFQWICALQISDWPTLIVNLINC